MNYRRLIIFVYTFLFLSLAAGSGVFFWQTRQEYTHLLVVEQQSKQRVEEAKLKLREQERVLERLRNDPTYVEMVIRRRLGYAKPDEMIYRFPSPQEATAGGQAP